MSAIDQLCRRMRRQWVLEHALRGVAWTLGWAVNAALLCLVLHRLLGLPWVSLLSLALVAAAWAGMVLLRAWWQAPRGRRLAQLLDNRAGAGDLFASALEFQGDPPRFGWLGELTCQQAHAAAPRVVLLPHWSLRPARQWTVIAAVAGVLLGAYGAILGLQQVRSSAASTGLAAAEVVEPRPAIDEAAGRQKPSAGEAATSERPAPDVPEVDENPADKPPADTVKITNEMIDRYLQQVPEEDKISLEGITPIRWDEEEASGKANPQGQRKPGEKIDPVKLDAAFLKDLEAAKKTKEEGGKEGGGVDIAVMGRDQGAAAKGKSGGKEGKESLADAASKDPRGSPTRLAVTPARKGLQITSAVRSPSSSKGQVRPMGLLEFLAAMKRAQAAAGSPGGDAAPAAGRAPDAVIATEAAPEAAGPLIESYFRRLREADR